MAVQLNGGQIMKTIKIAGVEVRALTKADMVAITPADAKATLERNSNFRKINQPQSDSYARILDRGDWEFNGDTIAFDVDGNLKDGQHRMKACMSSNKPMHTFPIIIDADTHTDYKRRTGFNHVLGSHGHKHNNAYAAGLRLLYLYENVSKETAWFDRSTHISNNDMWKFYEQHPKLADSVNFTASYFQPYRSNVPHSMLSVFHYLASRKSKKLANTFIETLGMRDSEFTEAKFKKTDSIVKLRDFLQGERDGESILPYVKGAHMVLAWNHWRSGTPCTKLRWRAIGSDAEKFPKIK
jgi:hypothetical protein